LDKQSELILFFKKRVFMFRRLFIIAAVSVLAACGGGDGDSADTSAVDKLYASYEKVTQGMSYEQVIATVGYGVNEKIDYSASSTAYTWSVGSGSTKSLLSVTVIKNGALAGKSGVVGKIIAGSKGTRKQSYL
jgi:hypothetical protein